MWRWVTRGLVLSFMALLAPLLFAQTFVGDVDSPDPNQPQSGMVLVKGWVLDPHQLTKIELYVDDQYQHNAVLFLPRIDIIEAFPDWPGIHNARPGFITGFSANRFPNGPHTIELRVYNSNGDVNLLGRRTIQINNTINQAPFGFLDIPDAAGITNVSGAFPVNGWAADLDGIDRIEVLIDDGIVQGAIHGDPRPDVFASFPDFSGALYSGYVANVDSTRIQNGLHQLQVRAVDRLGVSKLIGRRTVQVINNDGFLQPFGYLEEPQRDAVLFGTGCGDDAGPPPVSPPIALGEHITPVRGWALDLGTRQDTGRVAYVDLMVDGVPWLSTAEDCGVVFGEFANCYGLPRSDVQLHYPHIINSNFSGWAFTFDTRVLSNARHRLTARTLDGRGNRSEIGSVDFFVLNNNPQPVLYSPSVK